MDTPLFATWDEANQRFRSPLCCPEPACGHPVEPLATPPAAPMADRCPECGAPFERTSFRTQPGAPPLEITRRLDASFCTMTGQELTLPSPLDWSEVGGGPGRTGCLPDPRGAFFGSPNRNRVIDAQKKWERDEVFGPDREAADPVRSIVVVRGRLVVTSAGGRTAVLRAEDGASLLPPGECLEWPDGSADATSDECSVSHSAAVRSGRLCIVASHQVAFRDIREYLGRPSRTLRSVGALDAKPGCRFFGPPLGIDADRPLFALLEGSVESDDGELANATVLVVDAGGRTVSSWDATGIVRPPIYDRLNQVLVWVTATGTMCSVPLAQIDGGGGGVVSSHPTGEFSAAFDARSTLIVAPNVKGWAELWLAEGSPGGGSFTVRTALLHPRANPGLYPADLSWKWGQRVYHSPSGPVNGLSIGIGGPRTADSAADLAVVTSDEGVFELRKSSTGVCERVSQDSSSVGSIRGSADSAVLCSAGILFRTSAGVFIHSDPLGWSQDGGTRRVDLRSTDRRQQGLVMLGRRAFVGLGTGVVAIDLEPKECR